MWLHVISNASLVLPKSGGLDLGVFLLSGYCAMNRNRPRFFPGKVTLLHEVRWLAHNDLSSSRAGAWLGRKWTEIHFCESFLPRPTKLLASTFFTAPVSYASRPPVPFSLLWYYSLLAFSNLEGVSLKVFFCKDTSDHQPTHFLWLASLAVTALLTLLLCWTLSPCVKHIVPCG